MKILCACGGCEVKENLYGRTYLKIEWNLQEKRSTIQDLWTCVYRCGNNVMVVVWIMIDKCGELLISMHIYAVVLFDVIAGGTFFMETYMCIYARANIV